MKSSIRKNSTLLTLLSIALSSLLFQPARSHAAEETSYAQEIRQYVDEDKVYLLENIRQKVTRPSEKIVIEALLSEDGPQAVNLYKKQLREHPDPAIDRLSASRIAAYELALSQSSSPLKSPLPLPKAPADTARPANAELPLAVKGASPASKDSSKKTLRLPAAKKPPAKKVASIAEDTTSSGAIRSKAPRPAEAAPKKMKSTPGPGSSALQAGSFSSIEYAEAFVKKISPSAPAEVVKDGAAYKVRLKKVYLSKKEAEDAARALPFKAIAVPAN
ncbi:MAG: SPOR domain-containing protein [Chlorobiaceae bacterium]